MSDHTTALVPLESWCYSGPEVRVKGRSIDIGLFAEALIYYEHLFVNIGNQPQLAELLEWFITQGRIEDFLSLVRDGTVKLYDYSFASAAVRDSETDNYYLLNIQDPVQKEMNTFEKRFLYHESIEALFPHARQRKRLYQTLRGNVIEAKADAFGNAIENALTDYHNPRRNVLILQAFVDELFRFRKLGHPPQITVTIQEIEPGKHQATWNINFAELARLAGEELNFHAGTPLTAAALSNRLIWSASQLSCDLYIPSPMAMLVGDKLYESTERVSKAGAIIEELKSEVEFPDVRKLVNERRLPFEEILRIRKKAQKFRRWLQQESERDRNAIIAYHHEAARELGIVTTARRGFNIFGILTSGALGSFIGDAAAGSMGAAVGGAIGSGIGYLTDLVSKIGADWKPVVFGNWYRSRIENHVNNSRTLDRS